jgi:murein tripeptide amidase MpaA
MTKASATVSAQSLIWVRGPSVIVSEWLQANGLVPLIHGDHVVNGKRTAAVEVAHAQAELLTYPGLEVLPSVKSSVPAFGPVVGTGNRFKSGSLPASFGTGQTTSADYPYCNNAEIETAMRNLARCYPDRASLFVLPNKTWRKKRVMGLRLQHRRDAQQPGIALTGCLHGDEWGSSEALMHLAADLLLASENCFSLSYGQAHIAANEVQRLIERRTLFVIPMANPDGRLRSQTEPGQAPNRQNCRPPVDPADPFTGGVDLNRNFDFLFDSAAFDPLTGIDDCEKADSANYHGPHSTSEPEVKNVCRLLNAEPRINWLVDLHSPGCYIGYPWSTDEAQGSLSCMNFREPEFNRQRGARGDVYKEFLADADSAAMTALARRFCVDASKAFGSQYLNGHVFSQTPRSGTCIDYAYARHLMDRVAKRSKVLPFIVEWGKTARPSWSEMEAIVKELSAGLIGFCLQTIDSQKPHARSR